MKVTYKNKQGITDGIIIDFHYDTKSRKTTCRVFPIPNQGNLINFCTVRPHYKDKYEKEKGRRLALKGAIAIFPKELRTEIWETYRTLTKVPRWNKPFKKSKKVAK